MDFITFKELLDKSREAGEFIDEAQKLRIDLIETPLFDAFSWFELKLYEEAFGEEASDLITWYLYEKPMLGEGNHMFEKDGTPIDMETDEDLWNYIVNNYSKEPAGK